MWNWTNPDDETPNMLEKLVAELIEQQQRLEEEAIRRVLSRWDALIVQRWEDGRLNVTVEELKALLQFDYEIIYDGTVFREVRRTPKEENNG